MTDETVVARRLVVRGRVQGVFYRDTCRREAARLGVRGWVRNEPDGTVAVLAEGPRAAVDALVAWARHGPSDAAVEDVEVEQVDPTDASDFRVS